VDHFEIAPGAGHPIGDEVRSHLLEPFIAATRATLAEMAGTEVVVRTAARTDQSQALGDVSAVVRLTSATEGYLVLGFPQRTAAALTERILTGVLKEIDEDLICDCVGEIANVVAGQAKSLLAGTPYHFSFSLPRVVVGCPPELGTHPNRECLVVAFGTDLGEIALQLLSLWQESTTDTT
jgi:chemotaxis protein CheX